jgi:pyruvate formate-lyase activating enzyme-like uncharacterized protein
VPNASPTPIVVSQTFVDDCTKAFTEVVELRDAVAKYRNVASLTLAERQASDAVIKGLNELIAVKDRIFEATELKAKLYERIIEIQSQMIEKLNKQLNKGKSGFEKFVSVLKVIGLVLAGAALAR